MKKAIAIGLALVVGIAVVGYATADPRPHAGGWGMMGPGHGRGFGPGWMHGPSGYGRASAPGFGPCWGYGAPATGERLTKEKAEAIVKNRLAFLGNPNLKLGTVKEEGDHFVAEVLTQDNSLVDRLRIDKRTGFVRPIR